MDYDVLFLDPPWGGLNYKSFDKLMIYLDKIPLYDVINNIKKKISLVVLKLPNNFDISLFKNKLRKYTSITKQKKKNYQILYLQS